MILVDATGTDLKQTDRVYLVVDGLFGRVDRIDGSKITVVLTHRYVVGHGRVPLTKPGSIAHCHEQDLLVLK